MFWRISCGRAVKWSRAYVGRFVGAEELLLLLLGVVLATSRIFVGGGDSS
jgi:hypothetical protein